MQGIYQINTAMKSQLPIQRRKIKRFERATLCCVNCSDRAVYVTEDGKESYANRAQVERCFPLTSIKNSSFKKQTNSPLLPTVMCLRSNYITVGTQLHSSWLANYMQLEGPVLDFRSKAQYFMRPQPRKSLIISDLQNQRRTFNLDFFHSLQGHHSAGLRSKSFILHSYSYSRRRQHENEENPRSFCPTSGVHFF